MFESFGIPLLWLIAWNFEGKFFFESYLSFNSCIFPVASPNIYSCTFFPYVLQSSGFAYALLLKIYVIYSCAL